CSASYRCAAAAPQLPDMKTPDAKLKALEYFRATGPWKSIKHTDSFASKDLDRSLEHEIKLPEKRYAPPVDDATFFRRVSFDLTGQPPKSDELSAFVADTGRDKRSKLIDRLLDGDAFAHRWARFWTNVMLFNSQVDRRRLNEQALEDWLAGQFREKAGWDRIVAQILSADGKNKDNGPDNFGLACENQPTQLAAETTRVFMGVSIQCAECHDHPFDRWKRIQFHELAAFFSGGKYYMPDLQHPEEKTEVPARFLLGEQPPPGLPADARRVAVAAYLVYNPGNYWFARAYVNRVWNELLGDGFYAVDSLGPDGDVSHKLIVNRMAYVFRNRQFDPRWPFRVIMNSESYQRQARSLKSSDVLFTAVRATRLRPDQVAEAIAAVVGNDKLTPEIERIFNVDPSLPLADVKGAIQQALFLMNNPALQSGIKSGPLVTRLLKISSDDKLAGELYLSLLGREPNERELHRALDYLKQSRNRQEAVTDLVWILVNSTEFLSRR
ncbi:MAG TPA: DUF1549 domain-containing protein, partial [Pirellulales bacterium]|nr:DUF1549 domain-containing protein [Pirellulales bacterium]